MVVEEAAVGEKPWKAVVSWCPNKEGRVCSSELVDPRMFVE